MYTNNRFTKEKILKPPVKLIGAKTRWRDVLYQYFPAHNFYIESFLGTAGIIIGKEKSQIEIVGDINSYVINFYHQIQQNKEQFWEFLELELKILSMCENPKIRFENYKKWVIETNIPLNKAIYFYLVTKLCMNGIWRLNKKGECNSSYCGTIKGRGFLTKEWLNLIYERIKNINFICGDYQDILKAAFKKTCYYSDPFVFLDPPYHDCKTTYNGIGWKDKEYSEFAEKIQQISCKWLLTINDNEFIRELFKDYFIINHDVLYSCSQSSKGRFYHPELLIANYPLVK